MRIEDRIYDRYTSLYYSTPMSYTEMQSSAFQQSREDAQLDDLIREHIQRSFATKNVILTNNPSNHQLELIMIEAYTYAAEDFQGTRLNEQQCNKIADMFREFTKNHSSFYEQCFSMYEYRYSGETVDFRAKHKQDLNLSNGKSNDNKPLTYKIAVPEAVTSIQTKQYEVPEESSTKEIRSARETLSYSPIIEVKGDLEL